MKAETIEKILNFLKEKEDKEIPSKWFISIIKFIEKLENHPDGTQYRHEGYLELSYTNIKKLPNDLYVDGYLNLTYCKQLKKLPKDLYVEGDLFINKTNIQELPDNLYVGGNLWVQGSNIQELPDNLYVVGSLFLNETNIQKLPNNLYVGRSLHIKDTPLANNYTDDEIYGMFTLKGGTIIGNIKR